MNIQLPPEQLKWLEEQVEKGHYDSIDQALNVAVDSLKLSQIDDDLSWAKPLVDEAQAEVDRGKFISGDEFLRGIKETLERLRK